MIFDENMFSKAKLLHNISTNQEFLEEKFVNEPDSFDPNEAIDVGEINIERYEFNLYSG